MERIDGARRTTIALYVCTYRRNEQLERLLASVQAAAEKAASIAEVGVVVVDDNTDGRAKVVADKFHGVFPLGIHYVNPGSGNIAIARNAGLEAGSQLAEWVAMTDDDCEVSPQWFLELIRVQRMGDADCVAGLHKYVTPATAPRWLREHPYLANDEGLYPADGEDADHAQTANAMIRSAFLTAHPEIRFDPELGKVGGEDMVFFHQAREAGLKKVFAANAIVTEEPVGNRLGIGYYLRAAFWFGNTMYLTATRMEGLSRGRGVLRGGKRLALAVAHPAQRLVARRNPEVVYTLSLVATALGHIAGPFGIEVAHPS